ncbi:MAG: PTS fructose transporter subunit IIA [Gammaproteobacteria bacterium]|nr:PTS fructose transporter subunit IIA [Gammaproteobacteria bacterium]MCW8841256.1 PTS fructose transporter subunit IIA [Gammaproteobacteria bacterium]MCW8928335.1 PTS fructose transporter subunit IIA [Gammaproteobacteria bacterium]MCW8958181.1 PTS fructose transporter subunit IIA [Gammaproteobacteria bacterium]MCW8973236.1 PTS fructose transporter subunit IIA [Gammaproteobacteria bacterium]
MSVSLLIIAHAPLGRAVLDVALNTLGQNPIKAEVLDIVRDTEPDISKIQAQRLVEELDEGDGVLVLTDIYGSTPSNIACALLEKENVRIVTGINLPMLFRVMNYAQLDLDGLTEKAVSGGHDGIMLHDPLCPTDQYRHA